jgi:hypothetical protein
VAAFGQVADLQRRGGGWKDGLAARSTWKSAGQARDVPIAAATLPGNPSDSIPVHAVIAATPFGVTSDVGRLEPTAMVHAST